MSIITAFLFFLAGVFALLGYMILRMLRSDGWDKSNATNALRAISFVVLHPEDLGRMFYLPTKVQQQLMDQGWHIYDSNWRPFWYISEDEFEGVVKTRAPRGWFPVNEDEDHANS